MRNWLSSSPILLNSLRKAKYSVRCFKWALAPCSIWNIKNSVTIVKASKHKSNAHSSQTCWVKNVYCRCLPSWIQVPRTSRHNHRSSGINMENKLPTFLIWRGVMKFTLSQWLHAEQFNIFFLYTLISVCTHLCSLSLCCFHSSLPLQRPSPYNSVTPLLPSHLLSQFHFQMYSYSWCFTFI